MVVLVNNIIPINLEYKREIDNQNKSIKRLRNSVDSLVVENVKLKKQIKDERTRS